MNEVEVNARLEALVAQRNEATDRCVLLIGQLAKLEQENKDLKAKLAEKDTKDESPAE